MKLTLWGDLAENEGSELEEKSKNNAIIVATNVKLEIYEGMYYN